LYTSEYQPPTELAEAFDNLAAQFDEFESRHRSRGPSVNLAMGEGLGEEFPDMEHDNQTRRISNALSTTGETMWEAGEDDGLGTTVNEAPKPVEKIDKRSAAAARMSILPSSISGVVGGLLDAVGAATGTTAQPPAKPMSFEEIQKEMEEARRKAREEARRLEDEEERLAQQQAMEREMIARKLTLEKQRQSMMPPPMQPFNHSPIPYEDEVRDEDVNGDEEEMMREAQRVMTQLEQLEKTAAALEGVDLSDEASEEVANIVSEDSGEAGEVVMENREAQEGEAMAGGDEHATDIALDESAHDGEKEAGDVVDGTLDERQNGSDGLASSEAEAPLDSTSEQKPRDTAVVESTSEAGEEVVEGNIEKENVDE
jgi:hypothetical protein